MSHLIDLVIASLTQMAFILVVALTIIVLLEAFLADPDADQDDDDPPSAPPPGGFHA
mgnify:CR=1 FL=1